ncbi:ATP-binding protein [Litorilituus lipolyticus]|uniref:histidine kinase n=2 Tax=Litorilituus lipolyticus TaxID=2491017 RepID=A0A502KVW9_9GAMM|nr:ATP-binding protein [Litorilituus lipolyticus]
MLIWAMCLPCLLITTVSLAIAGVSAYLIAFIVIVLSLLCIFVVVNNKQNSAHQIRTLSNILESMISGDYTLRGRLPSDPAFQELLNLVNSLADSLSLHKIEAQESRQLLERIMEQMDAMVIATDHHGIIVMANDSARKLLFKNNDIKAKLPLNQLEVGLKISQAESGIIDFNHPLLRGEHFLFKESFLSEGNPHQLYLITSAERLLLEKERKAWQSLLRVLSHEMNNSLTPIASVSQSIKQKLQTQDKPLNRESLLMGVEIINERASSLSSFIASYSQLSHLPSPNKTTFNLKDILIKNAQLFESFNLLLSPSSEAFPLITLNVDKQQFEQVLINLFKNADEAMANSLEKNISVSCNIIDNTVEITIADTGMGIANQDNLFVPFYSTKPQGSGIGLALCKQILFNHGGSITLKNRTDIQGAQAVLILPRAKHGGHSTGYQIDSKN